MAVPKNLKKSLAKKSSSVDDLIDLEYNIWQDTRPWKEREEDPKMIFRDALSDLAIQIAAQANNGKTHASDVYDSPQEDILVFLGKDSTIERYLDDSEEIYPDDMMDIIKDQFRSNINEHFKKLDVKSIKGFEDAYDAALKAGYSGVQDKFAKDLYKSNKFSAFVCEETTRYTG